MIQCCIDLIRLRVSELPFVKISVDEDHKMCEYLHTLPDEVIWQFEKHTERIEGARKILKFLRTKI